MKQSTFTRMMVMAIMLIATVTSNAQIVYSNGKLNVNNANSNNFYGLNINSWAGMYWTTCNFNNFFQLDVSPLNPRIAGTGDEIVFYNTQTNTFNNIQVANVYNYSDERAKTNIHPLASGLNTIMELTPVSYNWKEMNADGIISCSEDSSTVAVGPNVDQIQYGFLAQNVEKVLPNAVKTDKDGHKMVNYNAIFTVLVQAVQELQSTVEEQSKRIEELTVGNLSYTKSRPIKGVILNCNPNPTYGMVTIDTQLSNDAKSASIIIRSLEGIEEKRVSLNVDSQSVSLDLSNLKNGIHLVTLIVDGNISDSTRLVKE